MKANTLISSAILLCFVLSIACGGKGKTVEATNSTANLPISVKADMPFQNDVSKFDFNL